MQTEVVRVSTEDLDQKAFQMAKAVLAADGLVAFPTETVYGLGANAFSAAAVARIFAAKGRPANNPLIVHIADAAGVGSVANEWPANASRLAKRFWPGPLTLVLPKRAEVPDAVTGGGPTVAVRVPAHPVALALLRVSGMPIAAPSANRSSQVSPTQAAHVLRSLEGQINLILDGGSTSGGIESTIIDVTTKPPRLLRPGLITTAQIEAVIGPLERPVPTVKTSAPLPAPGMLERHYAPRAPLECVKDEGMARAADMCRSGWRVGWVRLSPISANRETRGRVGLPSLSLPSEGGLGDPLDMIVVEMPSDPAAFSAQLYATLHELDNAGVDRIVVDWPPDTDEWLAVRDRLRRAAVQ
jgi:L-threonylcarbamoyladenylate synthase